jgi:parallel beta-helix repeat protein
MRSIKTPHLGQVLLAQRYRHSNPLEPVLRSAQDVGTGGNGMALESVEGLGISWSEELEDESYSRDRISLSRFGGTGTDACVTVIVVAIALALAFSSCLGSIPAQKAKILGPETPYLVYGYTFAGNGSILPSCSLKVLDRTSMNSSMTSSDSEGKYQFDLSSLFGGYQTGDVVWLLGNKTTEIGLNKTSVTGSGGKWLNLTLSEHTPIRIDSNADFDAMHGVTSGSGTAIDPYVIESRDISGSGIGYCIYIGNTTDNFVVRNCLLHDASGPFIDPWVPRAGIVLHNTSNGLIWNNTCSNDAEYSIYLNHCPGDNIASNNSCAGDKYGIFLYSSTNNEILNNTCMYDVACGIVVNFGSSGNLVANNTCQESAAYAIGVGDSCYNTIRDNIATSNSQLGIFINNLANNNTVAHNMCTSTNNVGIYLEASNYNFVVDNICSHSNNGIGLISSSTGNLLANNTCTYDKQSGVFLQSSNSNSLNNNTCSNNSQYGVNLYLSSGNALINNTCSGNAAAGILIHDSGSNTLSNNSCSDSDSGNGILIVSSSVETLRGNVMVNDGIEFGSSDVWNSQDIDTSNTVNGKPVYYYKNKIGGTVPTDAGQVLLGSCQDMVLENVCLGNVGTGIAIGFSSNIAVRNNSLFGIVTGIALEHSNGNTITNNSLSIMDRGSGIYLSVSTGNTITKNNCSDSASFGYGMYIMYSPSGNTISDNVFYHNSGSGLLLYSSSGNSLTNNTCSYNAQYGVKLVSSSNDNRIWNNTFDHNNGAGDTYDLSHVQAYDGGSGNLWNSSGSPHGYGNYWSDWIRPDANGDLIVDSPYVIGSSHDYYPRTWASNWTLHLLPGWNFVSVPLADFTYNASTLGLATGDMVCKWDSSDQLYSQTYIAGLSPPSQDFVIGLGTGYFIWSAAEENLTLLGDHPTEYSSYSIPLDVPFGGGWVAIGWMSFDSSRQASDLASYVTGGAHTKFLCKWNSTTQKYMSYIVEFSPPGYDFTILPGDAMWLWVDAPGGLLTYSP